MRRSQLPLLLLLLTAIITTAWLFWPTPHAAIGTTEHDPATTTAAQPAIDSAEADPRTDQQPPPAAAERAQVAADEAVIAAAMAAGKALVRITTRTAEGKLQPQVMIDARPLRGNRIYGPVGKGLTDEHGRIEFTGVEPCKLYLSTDRRDRMNVEVKPGLNEVDFEVKAGIDVVGTVLDPDGAPVAGATIWLQTASNTWDGGRVLGETVDDGSFTLDNVAPNCSLGAFARGFGPSPLIDLDVVDQSSLPARVELHLLPQGGDLTGRVTDRDGAPVAGAQVAVGDGSQRADYENDRVIEVWGIRCVETDGDGRYTVLGVPAGDNVVTARAPGFGIWRGNAGIMAGTTTTLDPTLLRSAVLFGTVTDKDGVPDAGARISAYDREPGTHFLAGGQIDFDLPFGNVGTVADEQGRYRLEGVTPGTAWLFAQRQSGGTRGGVSVAVEHATIEIVAGSEMRWDPVIDVGRSVAGVVRYRDGYPIPHLFITLHDERTGEDRVINSDKEGCFRFLCLDDSTYEVRVQPPFDAPRDNVPPRRSGIVPDQGPVEITVEYDKPKKEVPGTVSGRIADAGGRIRNPKATTVTLDSDAGWFFPGNKVVDGAFRFEQVRPCRFRVILKEEETVLASTDWFELAAAGEVDVGVLTTEPAGALRIHVARAEGAEDFEPKLYLRREGDPLSTTIAPGRSADVLVPNLTPGDYEVSGWFKGMIGVKATSAVSVGQTADLTIELQPGATGKIDVWWPEDRATSERRGYRITDASGTVVQEYEGRLHTMPTRPYELRFTLAAGRQHLEFWTDDGLRGELDFEIPASLVAPTLRVDLK